MSTVFEPDVPFDEMCARAERDVRAYWKLLQHDKKTLWNELAGARLAEMINSRDVTIHYLSVADKSLRLTAASLVAEYWQFDERFATHCLRIAFKDPEAEIRGAALNALLYKLHSYVDDESGMFRKFLAFLRSLDRSLSDPSIHAVREHAAELARWAGKQALLKRQRLAGEQLDDMIRSPQAAMAYLDQPNGNLRSAAILVLHDHWKNEAFDLRGICMRILIHDRDVEVRIQAEDVLSCVCFKTDDGEVGKLLANIVRDTSEPIKLRKAAYVSLFSIRGLPAARILQAAETDFQDPSAVDWEFVENFL